MIVLYGATGYTGRLIARQLADSEESFVVAGRNEAKLKTLVDELAAQSPEVRVESRVASPDDRRSLDALVEGADAVTSAAGPFAVFGLPLVEACNAAGVPYCDTTGEPGFMLEVARRFGDGAAPIVPAAGFDYVPHDLAAALAVRSLDGSGDGAERVDTVLLVRQMAPTRGTIMSALGAAADRMPAYVDGQWRTERVGEERRSFSFPSPTGAVQATTYGGGDAIQIANHSGAPTVRTWVVLPGPSARLAGPFARLGNALLGLAPVRRAAEGLVGRLPEGPSLEQRQRTVFAVLAEATAKDGTIARTVVTGQDIYLSTAVTNAAVARRLAGSPGDSGAAGGFRAPSEVVGDPVVFAAECGLELRCLA
jgi:short subunit dehydrogenase-like uncharacterized protein